MYAPYLQDSFDLYDDYSEVLDASRENLSRWQNAGVISAWIDVVDWRSVQYVYLTLVDSNGREVTLQSVENLDIPRENNSIKSDDAFPDFEFNCANQTIRKWEDFMLVNGRNFVFWEYTQPLPVDMSQIVSWKVSTLPGDVTIAASDIVIHDGLCGNKNSLNGAWSSPNGLPQYGVWWTSGGSLVMQKVEQEQYPSNGDHTRILSSFDTPRDFILRVKFTVENIPESSWWGAVRGRTNDQRLANSYIRIGWDFDDAYDPGHDQTLIYNALQYEYFGLQRVYPVERYFIQGFEPDQNDEIAKTNFSFENGKTYEVQARVEGQTVQADVYEVRALFLRKVASVRYTFTEKRPMIPYPFSIEATGNVDVIVHEIEIKRKQ